VYPVRYNLNSYVVFTIVSIFKWLRVFIPCVHFLAVKLYYTSIILYYCHVIDYRRGLDW
jgi:hypothetical protein